MYCGRESCLKSIESDIRIASYSSGYSAGRSYTTTSAPYGSGTDEDRDYDESFQTPWGSMGHRRGTRGFGGSPTPGLNKFLS